MDEMGRREFMKAAGATVLTAGAGMLLPDVSAAATHAIASAARKPKRGGKLNVGIAQVIEDINPYTADFYRYTQLIALTMYEPLIWFGDNGTPVPALAESWQHSRDYKTWTFHIRQGVKFHTGKALTAADVVYSLNQINDAKKPVTAVIPLPAGVWAGAKATGRYTVVVKLHKPTSLEQAGRRWWILPEHSRQLGAKLESESIGTGPFALKAFVSGSKIEVERNPDYWNPGQPYLDSMSFAFLTDISSQIANYRSGVVNMLHDVGVLDLKEVAALPSTKILPGGTFWACWIPQMLFGPLANQQVRVGLQHAFDMKSLNTIAWVGKGKDFGNPVDTTPFGIHAAPVSYDIDLARSMIKSAGAAGQEVDLNVLAGSPTSALEAQVLVEDFNNAGLVSKIVTLDPDAWIANSYTNRTGTGLFNNYGTLAYPYPEQLNSLLQPSINALPPKYPSSPTPTLLKAYNNMYAAYTNNGLKGPIKEVQRLMISEAASYPTFTASLGEAVPKNLQGVVSTNIGDIRFGGAYFS
jgi:peptide/nickel transport system substrate-binding protein